MSKLRNKYLHFLSGHVNFVCGLHRYPLTSEVRCSGKLSGVVDDKCSSRNATISCPIDECSTGVCRKHGASNEKTLQFVEPRGDVRREGGVIESDDSSDSEDDTGLIASSETSIGAELEVDPELAFLTDSGFTDGFTDDLLDSTNAGVIPQLVSTDQSTIGMNLFLAADVQPLRRRAGPVQAPLAVKRFLQNLVFTNNKSVPFKP